MRPIKVCMHKEETENILKYLLLSLPLNGDTAECGVAWGGTSRRIIRCTKDAGYNKKHYMFDTLAVLPDLSIPAETAAQRAWKSKLCMTGGRVTKECVVETFKAHGLENYEIIQGLVADTLPKFDKPLCFIHGDVDLYKPMVEVGKMAERLLTVGGYYIAHDYKHPAWIGVEMAIKELLGTGKFKIIEEVRTQCVLQKIA